MRVNRQSSGNADGEEASRSDLGRMPLQAGTGRRGRWPRTDLALETAQNRLS